jgi:hypothetical protein
MARRMTAFGIEGLFGDAVGPELETQTGTLQPGRL